MHSVPFARSDIHISGHSDIVEWLGVGRLLEKTAGLPPEQEFALLIEFLVEFAGGYELAEHRMYETCVEQAALSYKAYSESVRRIKTRLMEFFNRQGGEADAKSDSNGDKESPG